MLFAVKMDIRLPTNMEAEERSALLAREKAYSQDWQRSEKWLHIWRIAGQYSNLSIFDVSTNDELHQLLWNLPLFPYMSIEVAPLAPHPSSIRVPINQGEGL